MKLRMTRNREIILDLLRKASAMDRSVPIREMREATGLRSPGTIHSNLMVLEELGLAERDHTGKWYATDGFVRPVDQVIKILNEVYSSLYASMTPEDIATAESKLEQAIAILEGRPSEASDGTHQN